MGQVSVGWVEVIISCLPYSWAIEHSVVSFNTVLCFLLVLMTQRNVCVSVCMCVKLNVKYQAWVFFLLWSSGSSLGVGQKWATSLDLFLFQYRVLINCSAWPRTWTSSCLNLPSSYIFSVLENFNISYDRTKPEL